MKGFRAYNGLPNDQDCDLSKKNVDLFKSIYGSPPHVIAYIWKDIAASDGEESIDKIISEKGFKQFLIAVCFL